MSIKVEYGIHDNDMYNMNKNEYIMGIVGSSKVVFLKYQIQTFENQPKNREWSSLLEAIDTTSQQLPLFIILKDKKWKDD